MCPVLGTRLGSMGPPVKVLVGGQPVYVCCKGCVAKIQANPEQYVAKATRETIEPPQHAHHGS